MLYWLDSTDRNEWLSPYKASQIHSTFVSFAEAASSSGDAAKKPTKEDNQEQKSTEGEDDDEMDDNMLASLFIVASESPRLPTARQHRRNRMRQLSLCEPS